MPLSRYDTVHGRLQGEAEASKDELCSVDEKCPDVLVVNGQRVNVFNAKNPAEIPWAAAGVEYVIESTGVFTDVAKASAHLKAGAKKVGPPPAPAGPRCSCAPCPPPFTRRRD